MQPFLFISGDVPGLIYLNGRLAGGAAKEPVCLPVSPTGAVYIEYMPLTPGYLPFTRTLALSAGEVVQGSLSPERGLSVLAWPEGVAELSVEPEPVSGYAQMTDDAGVYVDEATRQFVTPLDDVARHALVQTLQLSNGEWRMIASEVMWAADGPKWPDNPEDTAIAACQAAILHLPGEASGYVAPAAAQAERRILDLYGRFDGCAKATYSHNNDVALVRVEGPNFARVTYAGYSCSRLGGMQGEWRLDDFYVKL